MSRIALVVVFAVSLLQQAGATPTPSWACALKPCILKSPLASAGPDFVNIAHFNAMGAQQKNAQEQCPFGGDDGPPPSQKEYNKYMKELHQIGSMSSTERAAWAHKTAAAAKQKSVEEIVAAEKRAQKAAERGRKKMEAQNRASINPSVDVSAPGIEAVNDVALRELRNKKEYDLLVTFYAPWCPHCKAFVNGANAPVKALSDSLEANGGPKVVTFDVTASQVPSDLRVEAVPTIYLIRKTGQPATFNEDPHDLQSLEAFALGNAPAVLLEESANRHRRSVANKRLRGPKEQSQNIMPSESADEYVDPEKAWHKVGDSEVYVTVVPPPQGNTPVQEEAPANSSAEEYVDPDKDLVTENVIRSNDGGSNEDQKFHMPGEKEEWVAPKDAFHVVGAKEEYIPVAHAPPAALLEKSAKRQRKTFVKKSGPDDHEEYVDPEKAFHTVGDGEQYVTVVPPVASAPVEGDADNSSDAYVDADKDFHSVNILRSDDSATDEDQKFHMSGEPEEWVDPKDAFHPVGAPEEYITVVHPPQKQ